MKKKIFLRKSFTAALLKVNTQLTLKRLLSTPPKLVTMVTKLADFCCTKTVSRMFSLT